MPSCRTNPLQWLAGSICHSGGVAVNNCHPVVQISVQIHIVAVQTGIMPVSLSVTYIRAIGDFFAIVIMGGLQVFLKPALGPYLNCRILIAIKVCYGFSTRTSFFPVGGDDVKIESKKRVFQSYIIQTFLIYFTIECCITRADEVAIKGIWMCGLPFALFFIYLFRNRSDIFDRILPRIASIDNFFCQDSGRSFSGQ